MSIYQPGGQLDYDRWNAEQAKVRARQERRQRRAARRAEANPLPLIPPTLRVALVGLFGAVALAWVAAYMWAVL